MAQDDKKNLSVAVDISGTIYHMIVIYVTPVQNDDVSSVFFIFSKFWFFGLLRGLHIKNWSKMRKHSVFRPPYLRNYTSFDSWFFIYSTLLLLLLLLLLIASNSPKWQKMFTVLDISQTIHYMVVICGTQV